MRKQADKTQRRTRFARLYADGSLAVMPAGHDFLSARKSLIDSSDDPDVEMIEVEITVVRTHGRPKLRTVSDRHVRCKTCGEDIYVEETQDGEITVR